MRHRRHPTRISSRFGCEPLEPRELLAADPVLSEFLASNNSTLLDGNGNSSDWIEIRNAGDASIDLDGWYLTDDPTELDKWQFPSLSAATVSAGEYLVVFASGDGTPDLAGHLHTGFQLAASGEYVALVAPSLTVISEFNPGGIDYPEQYQDVSYGIDLTGETGYFITPTPGQTNATAVDGLVADTTFSVDRGYFSDPFSVDASSLTLGATLVYTTDGSVPSLTHGTQVFAGANTAPTASVSIGTTTTLRAAAFKPGFQATNVDTQTYLFVADVIQQVNNPAGFPTSWGSAPAVDYEMDPEIVDDPAYTQDLLDGLRQLPALSIASDVDGVFGPGGIYSNPLNDTLEVPASAEWILPDGSTGFQIDAGFKLQGGASRNPDKSPKHSLSLRFRNEYGAGKLDYPLFDDSPVDSFNSLQLRAMFNNSWIHWDSGQQHRGTLIRDQFIRDSLLAMGQDDAGRGTYAHLYINGLYWGVYNVHERQEAAHYAAYNGGDASDYDALNGGAPVDGNLTSYNAMRATVTSRNWGAIQQVLDVDNFIDWTIAEAYGGNADLKFNGNWRVAGGGAADGLWRTYSWDSERVLEGVTAQAPAQMLDPMGILDDLVQIPEFVTRFGDRLQKHFFHDGALTPDATAARWNARVDELQLAIVAESARWGDYRRDVHRRGNDIELYERDVHWNSEINRLVATYFPQRSDFIVDQYRGLGLLPDVLAPNFQVNGADQHGGLLLAGSDLIGMTAPPEQVVVTDSVVVLGLDAAATAFVPTDDSLETGARPYWYQADFEPTGWITGTSGVGFEESAAGTYDPFLGTDVEDAWDASESSVYARFEFSLDAGYAEFDSLALKMTYDDGFVAYLNGQFIDVDANGNANFAPTTTNWQSNSSGSRSDSVVLSGPVTFDLTEHMSLLHAGVNVLAIHGLNSSSSSSDLLIRPELVLEEVSTVIPDIYYTLDGTDPRSPLGTIAGSLFIDDFSVNTSTLAKARTFTNGQWSALSEATFLVAGSNLFITEINYNPHDPQTPEELAITGIDNDDFEFVELYNAHPTQSVNLNQMQLTNGVEFTFENVLLQPHQRAVVVENVTAFTARYGDSVHVLGQYNGGLSNSGEKLILLDGLGSEVLSIEYGDSDPWALSADGVGATLVLADVVNTPVSQIGKYYHWRGSAELGGSPGAAGEAPLGVVINEVFTHTDPPQVDTIELFNPTGDPIDIGGWFLSDAEDNLFKFEIPAGTVLDSGQYITFDETNFNPVPATPGPNDFALNAAEGDHVFLVIPDETGQVAAFVDQVEFGAALNGESFGRVPNGIGRLAPLLTPTLGNRNIAPRVGPLIISEVNYHPEDPSLAAWALEPSMTDNDLEFIEIHNPSTTAVDLTDWQLRGSSDYEFVAGSSLAAGQTLIVVSFDPNVSANASRLAALQAHYGIGAEVMIVGGVDSPLSNGFARVELQRPDTPPASQPTLVPHVTEDEVLYDDLTPWMPSADGQGDSLQRRDPGSYGNDATSWNGASPTPGTVSFDPRLAGDYDHNGIVEPNDYEVWASTFNSTKQLNADHSGNGIVDAADHAIWRDNLGHASLGALNSEFLAATVPTTPAIVVADVDVRDTEHPPTSSRDWVYNEWSAETFPRAGNSMLGAGNSMLGAGNSMLGAGNSMLGAGNSMLGAGNYPATRQIRLDHAFAELHEYGPRWPLDSPLDSPLADDLQGKELGRETRQKIMPWQSYRGFLA